MVELLFKDPWSIVVVIVSILIVFALYYLGRKKDAAKLAYEFMVVAEKLIVGGEEKHNFVYDHLYPVLPGILKKIYTEKQIRSLIQYWFDKCEEKLKLMIANDE